MFCLNVKTGLIYTVKEHLSVDGTRLHLNVPLPYRQPCIYIKKEFPYYPIFIMVSAVIVNEL